MWVMGASEATGAVEARARADGGERAGGRLKQREVMREGSCQERCERRQTLNEGLTEGA